MLTLEIDNFMYPFFFPDGPLAVRPQRSEDARQVGHPVFLASHRVVFGCVTLYNLLAKNDKMGTKMHKMREEVFDQVFRAGAIRWVRVVVRDGRGSIVYVTGEGLDGVIYTKRGEVKLYRIETALHFLRRIGLASVEVDMHAWSLDGQSVLL